MIPTIEEIIAGLLKGIYTGAQADRWIKRHIELAVKQDHTEEPLSPEEVALLARIGDDFADCGETEVPYEKLLEFAVRGYLRCERFTLPAEVAAAVARGVSPDGEQR
jgi:hypothetical protein